MIEKQTVLILGAGASHELGLPLGSGLLRDVLHNLDPALQGTLDYPYLQILKAAGCPQRQLERLHSALVGTSLTAIDRLLEKRPQLARVGRAAIGATLLPKESHASLRNLPPAHKWCDKLFHIMTEGRDGFDANLLSIITFNYDRTVEHFLLESVRNLYGGSPQNASRKLKRLPIVHVHGRLGPYPPLARGRGLPFGADLTAEAVKHSLRNIKVIADKEENDGPLDGDDEFADAYKLLENAELVVILGFGFDEKNIRRLAFDEYLPTDATVIATAHGLDPRTQREARRLTGLGNRLQFLKMECKDFFTDHQEVFYSD